MSARRVYTGNIKHIKHIKLNFVAIKPQICGRLRTKYTHTNHEDWYDASYVEHAFVTSTILTDLQISRCVYPLLIFPVMSLSKKNGQEC